MVMPASAPVQSVGAPNTKAPLAVNQPPPMMTWDPMKEEILAALRTKGKGKGRGQQGGPPQATAPRKRIEFKGCWHCGADDHSRRTCKAFLKYLEAHNPGVKDRKNMKVPAEYEGKYEKALKAAGIQPRRRKISMLADQWDEADEDSDYGEPGFALTCALRAGYATSDDEDGLSCIPCDVDTDHDADDADDNLLAAFPRLCADRLPKRSKPTTEKPKPSAVELATEDRPWTPT